MAEIESESDPDYSSEQSSPRSTSRVYMDDRLAHGSLPKNTQEKLAPAEPADVNLILIGASGVGKSTIINSLAGKTVAAVGNVGGNKCTTEVRCYTFPIEQRKGRRGPIVDSLNVNIWDTMGFPDKMTNCEDAQNTYDTVINLIKTKEVSAIIWVAKPEKNLLCNVEENRVLMEEFNRVDVPVIVVANNTKNYTAQILQTKFGVSSLAELDSDEQSQAMKAVSEKKDSEKQSIVEDTSLFVEKLNVVCHALIVSLELGDIQKLVKPELIQMLKITSPISCNRLRTTTELRELPRAQIAAVTAWDMQNKIRLAGTASSLGGFVFPGDVPTTAFGPIRLAALGDSGVTLYAVGRAEEAKAPSPAECHGVHSDDEQEGDEADIDDLEYEFLDIAHVLPKPCWERLLQVLKSREGKAMDIFTENFALRKEINALRSFIFSGGDKDPSQTHNNATQFYQIDDADEIEYNVVESSGMHHDGGKLARFANVRVLAVMFPMLLACGVFL